MPQTIIDRLHREYKETKKITLPDYLLAPARGYALVRWAQELWVYYQQEGIIVRPFDELPPLKLSQEPGLETTIQDVHKFIVSDLNLIPLETRKAVFEYATLQEPPQQAWHQIAPLLCAQLDHLDDETLKEELTWKFSPVAEILWTLTWFFMERQKVIPPQSVNMVSGRFPYYLWLTDDNTQSFWEPEQPLCRWEWLAMDIYEKVKSNEQ